MKTWPVPPAIHLHYVRSCDAAPAHDPYNRPVDWNPRSCNIIGNDSLTTISMTGSVGRDLAILDNHVLTDKRAQVVADGMTVGGAVRIARNG